jgi:hypothetical protein
MATLFKAAQLGDPNLRVDFGLLNIDASLLHP